MSETAAFPEAAVAPPESENSDVLVFPGSAPVAPAEVAPLAPAIDAALAPVIEKAQTNGDGSTLSPKYAKPIPPELETVHPDILAALKTKRETFEVWKKKKKQAKQAKDDYEEAGDDLDKVIDEINNPSLFNSTSDDGEDDALAPPEPASASSSAPAPNGEKAAPADGDDTAQTALIRMTPIADLVEFGLTKNTVKLMNQGNLYTIGDAEDFIDPAKNNGNTHRRLTDIKDKGVKGFGEAKALMYGEAVTAFLKKLDNERFERDAAAKKAAEESETAAKVEQLLDRSGDEGGGEVLLDPNAAVVTDPVPAAEAQ